MGEELVPLRIGRELNLISDWVGCWIGLGAGAEATILIWVRPLCDLVVCEGTEEGWEAMDRHKADGGGEHRANDACNMNKLDSNLVKRWLYYF